VKGKDSMNCAYIIHNIGVAYEKQGKLNEALEYYHKELNIKEKVSGKESI